MTLHVTTRTATPGDAEAVVALQARVFGPGRFARSAYRVREGAAATERPFTPFCRVALRGERIIAAVKLTRVAVGGTCGALMLGPLAVDPDFAGLGYGRQLVAEALEAARKAGIAIVLLVGDEPYYGRFGFKRVPPGQIRLPGPVNPERILAAELAEGALARFRGLVTAV